VIQSVRIALSLSPVSACQDADADQDGIVTISELVMAVNSAIAGCR
jgi:hypothetical protein